MIIGQGLNPLISGNLTTMIIMNSTNPEELKALSWQIRSLILSIDELKLEVADLKALVQNLEAKPKAATRRKPRKEGI